jgi:hypothetical protein
MSDLVGKTYLRQDVLEDADSRLPEHGVSLTEDSLPLRKEDVVSPFLRARTTPAKTINEFYDLFRKVLEAATELDGTNYPIRFAKGNLPIESQLPCFTVKLMKRGPFETKGRKEYAFRDMEEINDPDFAGDILQTHMRREENRIRLTVWAADSNVMDDLANWLEDKFYEFLWVFQWAGMSHPVLWEGRGEDIYDPARNQGVYGAPIDFRVITAKITHSRLSSLRHLSYKLGLLVDNDPRLVSPPTEIS